MKKTRISTRRQSEILQYIKDFLIEKGYPPSVREIGTAVGLKSSSTVHRYLAMLEENGAIRRDATKLGSGRHLHSADFLCACIGVYSCSS